MPNEWLLKKFLKKRKKEKKEPENVVGKRKEKWKKKKKMDNTNTFYFYFSDFWVWDWRMLFVVLFCWNCIAEDFVAQFDIGGAAQKFKKIICHHRWQMVLLWLDRYVMK